MRPYLFPPPMHHGSMSRLMFGLTKASRPPPKMRKRMGQCVVLSEAFVVSVNWVARVAEEVLDRIKKAGMDKEEWLRQPREASGFIGDDSELLKAISAYEGRRCALPPVRWLFELTCARVLMAGRIQRISQTTG